MNYTNKYIKYKAKFLELKEHIGGIERKSPTITDEDILYQDEDVCILHPNIKKGIVLFHHFDGVNVCEEGLKTGQLLHTEGVDFDRKVHHPYSFFRAPYYSNEIDYTSIETEIKSVYGDLNIKNLAFIRVDPSRTFTYSSEIRANIYNDSEYHNSLLRSRKTLTDYLRIIAENQRIKEENLYSQHVYNLYSSRIVYSVPYKNQSLINSLRHNVKFPQNLYPIERNSEVLVGLQYIPKNFFVVCDYTAETKDDDIYKFS